MIRNLTATIISPILRATGFRFDKTYRWADIQCTGRISTKGLVYAVVNTAYANMKADRII